MLLSDAAFEQFSSIQFRVRKAMAEDRSSVPFVYEDEPFFSAYHAISQVWKKRMPQREVATSLRISRNTLKKWDHAFVAHGAVGLLPEVPHVPVDPALEALVVLIKASRPHERANYALRLAEALELPAASLDLIRQIQRCHGYGQRMDERDLHYWSGLQHILESVERQKSRPVKPLHDPRDRAKSFFNYHRDHLQHRVELFKALNQLDKKRRIRSVLQE